MELALSLGPLLAQKKGQEQAQLGAIRNQNDIANWRRQAFFREIRLLRFHSHGLCRHRPIVKGIYLQKPEDYSGRISKHYKTRKVSDMSSKLAAKKLAARKANRKYAHRNFGETEESMTEFIRAHLQVLVATACVESSECNNASEPFPTFRSTCRPVGFKPKPSS